MNQYETIIQIIALSMGAAWASGLNLYAAIIVLGWMGASGNMQLPDSLQVLSHPMVMGAAGVMFVVEFVADKIPGVDSSWDALHTFVRVPAGAILAAAAVGEVSGPLVIAAGILGGGLATGTHLAKAGTRVMINASPEPVSNFVASFTEDVAVVGGLWIALNHPLLFLVFVICFCLLLIWLLPKLWSALSRVASRITRFLKSPTSEEALEPTT